MPKIKGRDSLNYFAGILVCFSAEAFLKKLPKICSSQQHRKSLHHTYHTPQVFCPNFRFYFFNAGASGIFPHNIRIRERRDLYFKSFVPVFTGKRNVRSPLRLAPVRRKIVPEVAFPNNNSRSFTELLLMTSNYSLPSPLPRHCKTRSIAGTERCIRGRWMLP